MRYKWTSYSNT